jgi:methylated-DNA-[protein]-cysteine S-methyltransferase
MGKELLIPWIQSSPLGRMLLLAREGGALLLCTWPDAEASPDPLSYCAAAVSAEVAPLVELGRDEAGRLEGTQRSLPRTAAACAETLDDYLNERSSELKLPIDLSLVRSQFRREVLQALYEVPRQTTTTYLQLANRVGRSRGAARSVGQAVATNPLAVIVPCHRVLASDGSLGGYSGGLWRKRWLLQLEGHALPEGGWPARRALGAAPAPV